MSILGLKKFWNRLRVRGFWHRLKSDAELVKWKHCKRHDHSFYYSDRCWFCDKEYQKTLAEKVHARSHPTCEGTVADFRGEYRCSLCPKWSCWIS